MCPEEMTDHSNSYLISHFPFEQTLYNFPHLEAEGEGPSPSEVKGQMSNHKPEVLRRPQDLDGCLIWRERETLSSHLGTPSLSKVLHLLWVGELGAGRIRAKRLI
jgi:hypothetical protein